MEHAINMFHMLRFPKKQKIELIFFVIVFSRLRKIIIILGKNINILKFPISDKINKIIPKLNKVRLFLNFKTK